jgi:CheY-like chemotaxis protein
MIASGDGGGKRVLVLEDEWLIADDLTDMLVALGYNVVGPTPRAKDALALIAGCPPEAAVLDISLDGHYSYSVAEELVRLNIPFLFLSGYAANDLPGRFRDKPLLQKPVSLNGLAAQMMALIG